MKVSTSLFVIDSLTFLFFSTCSGIVYFKKDSVYANLASRNMNSACYREILPFH
jgi:hypothetical protein